MKAIEQMSNREILEEYLSIKHDITFLDIKNVEGNIITASINMNDDAFLDFYAKIKFVGFTRRLIDFEIDIELVKGYIQGMRTLKMQ